eukprot:3410852-Pyramimonas_sp.AAC.1
MATRSASRGARAASILGGAPTRKPVTRLVTGGTARARLRPGARAVLGTPGGGPPRGGALGCRGRAGALARFGRAFRPRAAHLGAAVDSGGVAAVAGGV